MGVVLRAEDGVQIKLGDKALLIPSRCDPTVNLHNWSVAVRTNAVEAPSGSMMLAFNTSGTGWPKTRSTESANRLMRTSLYS